MMVKSGLAARALWRNGATASYLGNVARLNASPLEGSVRGGTWKVQGVRGYLQAKVDLADTGRAQ